MSVVGWYDGIVDDKMDGEERRVRPARSPFKRMGNKRASWGSYNCTMEYAKLFFEPWWRHSVLSFTRLIWCFSMLLNQT